MHTVDLGSHLTHVALIGGGRWARVICETLAGLLPATIGLSIHTSRNRAVTESWRLQRGLVDRIAIFPSRPEPRSGMTVIVANAARDHEEAIRWALRNRLPVLSEKPVTLSAAETAGLIDEAKNCGTLLCAGHVLLFASYFSKFAEAMRRQMPVSVEMDWTDPQGESRHGEVKTFDPGVPIHADCLPHVLSMLWAILTDARTELAGLIVTRGGAREDIRFVIGGVPVSVRLERNGSARRRTVAAIYGHGRWVLDFSTEPGTLATPEGLASADPDWPSASRPLAAMLLAFLRAAASGAADPRLAIEIGYRANQVIDAVSVEYERQLLPWTAQKMRVSGATEDPDLRYRLAEGLQAGGRIGPERLNAEISRCLRGVA